MSEPENNKVHRRSYGVACMTCRRAKTKCVNTGIQPHRCDRCSRLGKDCVYESIRRVLGRKNDAGKALRRDHNLPFNSSSASYQMGILGHQFTNAVSETADRWLDETFYSGPPSLDSHTSFAAGADVPSFLPPSFITRSEDARGLSLDSALDSTSTNVEATSQGDNSLDAGKTIELIWEREDPVSLKLLNRPAAQYLYDGISSKVFQPVSYTKIRSHTERLLSQALVSCDSAIETVWAIICLYHWKDVNDTRGYSLIGFALRLAASARWNKLRNNISDEEESHHITKTEVEVRQRRDEARIWLALENLDRTYWTYLIGDAKALGGYELHKIAHPAYSMMMSTRKSREFSHSIEELQGFQEELHTLNMEMVAWAESWEQYFTETPNPQRFHSAVILIHRDYIRLYFNSVLLHRMLTIEDRATRNIDVYTTLEVCYSSALVILRQITQIGKTGALYYFWDAAHLMVAYAAMVLPKLLKLGLQLPVVSMHEALEALHNVTAAYSNAAGLLGVAKPPTTSPSDSSLEAQTRLLESILAKLRSEVGFNMDKESRTNIQSSTTSSTSIEEQPAGKVTTSVYDNDIRLVHEELHMQDGIELTPEIRNEPDSIFDYDFMNSRFIDAGLLSWDEPGIFLQPH
ncbi:Protein priB [Fusarium oxysporum f. sp. cubense race 1]|uniref:Protein priB n=1 Tax=Fusarium oxysporum f. sp. cubense (strain race 1) TaxID=1229664 RepID=N4TVZ3_FUSC1|nr:Protein priB [Fusarium oxysporum f. sp. cubense race 1]